MDNEMTASKAFDAIRAAAVAVAYLETAQQAIVNGNGKVIAQAVTSNEDVDGSELSVSWKAKANATKFGKACLKMAKLAEAHIAIEAKAKAINTTATVEATKRLALTGKK